MGRRCEYGCGWEERRIEVRFDSETVKVLVRTAISQKDTLDLLEILGNLFIRLHQEVRRPYIHTSALMLTRGWNGRIEWPRTYSPSSSSLLLVGQPRAWEGHL